MPTRVLEPRDLFFLKSEEAMTLWTLRLGCVYSLNNVKKSFGGIVSSHFHIKWSVRLPWLHSLCRLDGSLCPYVDSWFP